MQKIEPATLESGNSISMLRTLKIHLQEIGSTHAIMEVTVNELYRNYFGGAHGGLIATLVDTVSFFPTVAPLRQILYNDQPQRHVCQAGC